MPATSTRTRRTSIYNVRVHEVHHSAMEDVLRKMARAVQALRPLTDQHTQITDHEHGYGYVSVGFRAADDDEARRVADTALSHLPGSASGPDYEWVTIHTGFGIHRREFPA